jgi:hypothetical protein
MRDGAKGTGGYETYILDKKEAFNAKKSAFRPADAPIP